MTIVIAAIKSDGHVSADEVTRLRAICALSPILRSNSAEEDDRLIGFADDLTSQIGQAAIERAAASLPAPLRETALAFACDMILADGMLAEQERSFIEALVGMLRVDHDTAQSIVATTIIRNRAVDYERACGREARLGQLYAAVDAAIVRRSP